MINPRVVPATVPATAPAVHPAPDRSSDDLWLVLHAHLHVLETVATTEAEKIAISHLVLARIELTDNGMRQPVTGETVTIGYGDAVAEAEQSALDFADRVRFVVVGLRRLERVAATLTDALSAGRSCVHAQDALDLLTGSEQPRW